MAALEKIVRPFQSPTQAGAFAVAGTKAPPQNVILQYGKSGGGAEVLQSHYSLSASWFMTKKWREAPSISSRDPSGRAIG